MCIHLSGITCVVKGCGCDWELIAQERMPQELCCRHSAMHCAGGLRLLYTLTMQWGLKLTRLMASRLQVFCKKVETLPVGFTKICVCGSWVGEMAGHAFSIRRLSQYRYRKHWISTLPAHPASRTVCGTGRNPVSASENQTTESAETLHAAVAACCDHALLSLKM